LSQCQLACPVWLTGVKTCETKYIAGPRKKIISKKVWYIKINYYLYSVIIKQKVMTTINVQTIFGQYECRSFIIVDPDVQGIEISEYGEHIGSMIGENLPDENDEDEIKNFINKLEIWIVENF
jgi:hypothetical protein